MKQYLKLNNILGVLVIVWTLLSSAPQYLFFSGEGLGYIPPIITIYNLLTIFLLFKKLKIGYILFGLGFVFIVFQVYRIVTELSNYNINRI